MTDLTRDTIHPIAPRGASKSFVLENGVTFYIGGLVGINAAGFLAKWQNVAGMEFMGILLAGESELANDTGVLTGDTTAAKPIEGRVDVSGPTLLNVPVASATQANVNSRVYGSTDNPDDFVLTATANVGPVGWVSRFRSAGFCDVTLFTPEEHRAFDS